MKLPSLLKPFLTAAAALLLPLLPGCLPPGDPPPGNIVENPGSEKTGNPPMPFPDAREKAVTELIAVFMLAPQSLTVYPQGDSATAQIITDMARECARFSGARVTGSPHAACCLRSVLGQKTWTIDLFSPQGELLWTREYPLTTLP